MPKCNYPAGCNAYALHGDKGRCLFHSEIAANVAKLNAGRAKGGQTKKVRTPRTTGEVKELLSRGLAEGMAGKRTAEELTALARLGQVLINVIEKDFDERLKKAGL